MRKEVAVIAGALLLAGCTTSHVLVGAKRPPISPEEVRLYLDPPPAYEKVAVLSANSAASFTITAQGKTNKVVERMKREAAALGANGILFGGVTDQYAGSVGTAQVWGYGNSAVATGFSAPVLIKAGQGIAIYVPPAQATAPQSAPAGTAPQSESQTSEMKWKPTDW